MGIELGSRVQWTLQDGITTAQGWVLGTPDIQFQRAPMYLVAVDPDPNGVDQVQKSVRNVVLIDIAALTLIPNQVPNI